MKKFLIVNKKILPDVYEKVIEARNLINDNRVKGISEAVKKVGISRSTYYKYKDYVFSPSEESIGRMAVFSLMLSHKRGVLSAVINSISDHNANILTINQSIPINGQANVTVSLDVSGLDDSLEDMIDFLKSIDGVLNMKLLSIE
ncbi:MAG: ACT domain-containing protein [Tissierellales bacterium]|nr:ACT domain-containing protein [Tissierellales bacterium]MBN2828174.1 ACT domain-containing protein [Tissierellales bacterium]